MGSADLTGTFSQIKSIAVPETENADFELRPVPANGSFFIAAAHGKFPAEISVTDMRGIVIFTQNVRTADEPVSTDTLPPGIYFVRMKGSESVQRLLVIR